MQSLDEKEWREFSLDDIFTVSAGKRLETRNKVLGTRPFIGATDNNNGVTGFVGNDNSSRDGNVLGVNYNGSPCVAFYHPYECIFTDDVKRLHLRHYSDNKFVLLFFVSVFAKQRSKYSYGYKFKEQRMLRQKLMLPITDSGKPDYTYMAEYAQQKRDAMLAKYCAYVEKRIAELGEVAKIPTLNEKEWKPIAIASLFTNISAGKISNASAFEKTTCKGVEYIAATNRNNGCLYFLDSTDELKNKIQDGNCIGFIKDGDGSAGYAIYKKEPFVSTVNVLYGYADWLNEATGLFFVAAQDMIEHKYSHGYKRNKEHLAGDKVMLPVTDSGEPDYEYMEQYAKNLMLKKYRQYLKYLNQR
ncbi:restriction endonuclease subunit S [Trueperella sp. LYQ143]|uniref:restriction endonuclease subunit S n=1 Tax=unclassified Trueperella TaxID=2630174 RepID=UPI0039833AE8